MKMVYLKKNNYNLEHEENSCSRLLFGKVGVSPCHLYAGTTSFGINGNFQVSS